MNKKAAAGIILWVALFAVAVENYAWARTDLDFMVNQYRYSELHREREEWIFSPDFSMPWWDAYIMTTLRLVFSCCLMGFLAAVAMAFVYYHSKPEKTGILIIRKRKDAISK